MKSHNLRVHQKIYGNILVGLSFFTLILLTVKILLPDIKTEAESQIAEQIVGPYEMSMANDSVATINITPTTAQAVYVASNNLTVKNTCDAGATIDMTMRSSTSNSLIRSGADAATKEISATTSSDLDDYSWGYTLDDSSYYAVPRKGETAAIIYDESTAQPSELTVPVKFGVKTDNGLPSGTYTNDVVYTMTPKVGCLVYDITWDYDGGTAKSGATYPTSMGWGDTVDLSQLTPTREGYTFAGWTNGSLDFADSETTADLNPSNAKSVTVKAKWELICSIAVGTITDFDYTGSVQTYTAPCDGYYRLEVWGASGGAGYTRDNPGYGGYSDGTINISVTNSFYIYVGGKGIGSNVSATNNAGWNGGGNGGYSRGSAWGGGGGGASDIRINNTSLYARVIVAGGGGGTGDDGRIGGYGGGESGRNGSSAVSWDGLGGPGGTIISGYSFGIGKNYSGSAGRGGGGGGGWYGGYDGGSGTPSGNHYSGGGGSGWIYTASTYSYWATNSTEGKSGNWLLDSSYYLTSASTYDGGTAFKSPSGANETGHSGNGYARITYLGVSI